MIHSGDPLVNFSSLEEDVPPVCYILSPQDLTVPFRLLRRQTHPLDLFRSLAVLKYQHGPPADDHAHLDTQEDGYDRGSSYVAWSVGV